MMLMHVAGRKPVKKTEHRRAKRNTNIQEVIIPIM